MSEPDLDIVPADVPDAEAPAREEKRGDRALGLAELWEKHAVGPTDPTTYVRIERISPKLWGGLTCKGIVEGKITHTVDETYIIQRHGGGIYRVQVMGIAPDGRGYRIRGQATVEIATSSYPPKSWVEQAKAPPAVEVSRRESGGHSNDLLSLGYNDATQDRRRMEEYERQARLDAEQARIATVRAEQQVASVQHNAALSQQVAELRAQIAAGANNTRESPTEIVSALMGGISGAMQPLVQMMQQQQQQRPPDRGPEFQTLIEAHRAELASQRSAFEQQMASMREMQQKDREQSSREHERDLNMMRQQFESEKGTLLASHASEVRILEAELGRLRGDVGHLREEARALQSQVRPTDIMGQIDNVTKLRNVLAPLNGGDEAPKSLSDRLLDRVLQSPKVDDIMGGIANRIGMGGGTDAPAQQQERPRRAVRRLPQQGGQVHPIRPVQPTAAEPAAEPSSQEVSGVLGTLVEAAADAMQSGKPPAEFAQEIASAMPAAALSQMLAEGPAKIVAVVEGAARSMGAASVVSVAGKKYVRDTVQALMAHR